MSLIYDAKKYDEAIKTFRPEFFYVADWVFRLAITPGGKVSIYLGENNNPPPGVLLGKLQPHLGHEHTQNDADHIWVELDNNGIPSGKYWPTSATVAEIIDSADRKRNWPIDRAAE